MAEFNLEFPLFDLDNASFIGDDTFTLFGDVNVSSDLQMQKTEKSPFHESDSGVSDTSGESPSWENDGDIPWLCEMLDTPAGPFVTDSSEIDEDLVQHLQSGVRSEQTDSVHVPKTAADSQTCRKTRSQSASLCRAQESSVVGSNVQATVQGSRPGNANSKTTAAEEQRHVSVSDEECEIDMADDEVVSRRKPKGSVQVKEVGERLPSTKNSEKCNVTSVKVLRIVKSGNDGNTEDDVTKALEERNRKNAEMARQNRLKKKEYVGNLEREVEEGRTRIYELESALNDVEEERDAYKREVEYLKSVLANQSALAGLLKNIPSVSGVTLSSSVSRKRVAELDHSYTPRKKSRHSGHPASSQSAGVCLHVQNDNVSLEFCNRCSDMASGEALS